MRGTKADLALFQLIELGLVFNASIVNNQIGVTLMVEGAVDGFIKTFHRVLCGGGGSEK
jgi:hypothetical protein